MLIEPTVPFTPFGRSGPRIALFGKSTGDWSTTNLQTADDYETCSGLYHRFDSLARHYGCTNGIFLPDITTFNAEVATEVDFSIDIRSPTGVPLKRGVKADGVGLPFRFAVGMATGDCPTIVAYNSSSVWMVVAHAGTGSIIDLGHVLHGREQRRNFSVVDSIVQSAKAHGSIDGLSVFVTCGIALRSYRYPELSSFVEGCYGEECVSGKNIDLRLIILRQFQAHGVQNVMMDGIDTCSDEDPKTKELLWHSYRRGKDVAEKAGRNLVLVYRG